MALTASFRAEISGLQTKVGDHGTANFGYSVTSSLTYTDGTGAAQVDRIFSDQRTLAASASEDIDLAGALTDIYGATATFARIKAVIVKASSSNTNNVNVTRPASNGVPLFMAAGDGIALRPGFAFAWGGQDTTGVAVTGGTGDLLTITNSAAGTSVTYDICVIGTSA